MNRWSLWAGFIFFPALAAGSPFLPPDPPREAVRTLSSQTDFIHETGRDGGRGRQVDHRRDKPGYVLKSLHDPLVLGPGFYRASYYLRRGHLPRRGLLHKTNTLFEIEIWDVQTGLRIASREIQTGDFSSANHYEPRWIEFSIDKGERVLEPRVKWLGLANGEAAEIQIDRFPPISLRDLSAKAGRIQTALLNHHLENGYVVARNQNNKADETGDALTYTGFLVAALAWQVSVTKDPMAVQALENGLTALHNAIKGDPTSPILTRFVDADNNPSPSSPSKDVYTAYFYAIAAALPGIENKALREEIRRDAERLGLRFLKDDLTIRGHGRNIVNLTPYFTEDEVRHGIQKLVANKKTQRNIVRTLKAIQKTVPFFEVWPGLNRTLKAIRHGDEEELFRMSVPSLNGAALILERINTWLKEQYRTDLFARSTPDLNFSGRRLGALIHTSLQKFPARRDGRRFQRLTDLRVLASNSLLALQIIRSAQAASPIAAFDEYYRSNLYANESLLRTAVDWFGVDDEAIRLASGNSAAGRARRGYLAALALNTLIRLETNPAVKKTYQSLMQREWQAYRHDDNPMMAAFHLAAGISDGVEKDIVLRALALYPENRTGWGDDYWEENAEEIAKRWGGGFDRGYSREPLPVSHRPKDSFLWQRNARRLKGDDEQKIYAGTDYLFLYWFARAHHIIPGEEAEPTVQR